MKAKIEKRDLVLTLEMSHEEFDLVLRGIGATSIHGRVVSGMSREQAYAIDHLYRALRNAIQTEDEA